MRADRLLSILLLLQVHRRMTARELARRLEVSERTIHRDMLALSSAGVPVTAERGIGGGWMLVEGYRTNLTGLTPEEIQALFLTQPLRLLADLGLDKASQAAMVKLLAAIPSGHRHDAEYVRQRIHVDLAGWRRSEESVPFLPVLQDAIWQERKLQFVYRRSDGDSVQRLVDPLGLVAKGSIWYLVAAAAGELRTYRVSRLQEVSMLDQSFERPVDFNLIEYWEQAVEQFVASLPRYLATLRIAPGVLSRIRLMWRFAHLKQVGPPDPDGWTRLAVQFELEQEACEYVLSLGPDVEVLEPEALRQQIIHMAKELVAFYENKAG